MEPSNFAKGIEKEFQAGEEVIQQGTRPGLVFWVAKGTLETHVVEANRNSRKLGEIYEGEFFGEMAALTGKPASANVRASTACKLIGFTYPAFFDLIESSPAWNRKLLRSISLRAQGVYLPPARGTVICLRPWSEGVDAGGFWEHLQPFVAKYATCTALSQGHPDSWGAELERCRESFASIFLVGDAQASAWNAFCEQEAEQQVYLAMPSAQPLALGSAPQVRDSANNTLVLLHPNRSQPPKGTKAWLETGSFHQHYHIAADLSSDWERLARCLTGHAVGLVCGGGGAKGAAHLGLMAAFVEVGIPIDYLVGTSAGALMSVCHAMDMPREDYLGFLGEISRKGRKLNDYTFPFLSLLAGKPFTDILQRYAGAWQIEDLWIPFACVSASLKSGKEVVHRQGSLFAALKASTAIPGIFPPQQMDQDLLVDGGVLNNAPVDITDCFPKGKLVLSDISQLTPIHLRGKFPTASSGWRLLFQYLNPFQKDRFHPALLTILLRSYELGALHLQQLKLQKRQPDLTIRIPVHDFGTLDFPAVRKIWELGYAYGLAEGKAWKQELMEE